MQFDPQMRIAIVGGTGRTGRRLVDAALNAGHTVRVLCRQAFDKEGIEEVRGDALDPARLRTLVHRADAVVCVLGPTRSSPPDLCSRSTALLVEAMKAEGVKRLVVQTGAMIGHPCLGPFYRWMARRRSKAAQLEDRRAQERVVQSSGLDWTLVRPPRLTQRKGTGAARVGTELPIRMLSSVARVDLAQVLLRAATTSQWTGEGVAVLQGLTASHPGSVLRRWTWAMGLAELLGLAFVAAVATGFLRTWGEPQSQVAALAFLACMLGAGAVEGALLGQLPGGVLATSFPRLSRRAFRRNTMLVVVGAWLVGMLPSTLIAGAPTPGSLAEPRGWMIALVSALAGALAGAVIGTAQWLALRKVAPGAGRWIGASALGWALALPLNVLAGTLPQPSDPWLKTLLVSAGLGLAAGVVVAIPTGLLLVRMLKERSSTRAVARAPPRDAPASGALTH
ncbi:MAG: NmrA family protein [Myxococcaceae bacterium]|nr:NmrA family protein [Myxococcaceae bacterium]